MRLAPLLPFLFLSLSVLSQPEIVWQAHYNSSHGDEPIAIDPCKNGGYIMVARSNYLNDSLIKTGKGNYPKSQILVLRLDENGEEIWRNNLGGSHYDWPKDVHETKDGGYIVAGEVRSTNGDVSFKWGTSRHSDAWMVKLDPMGNIEWEHVFGGTEQDRFWDIAECPDGGYVATGTVWSVDGILSPEYRGYRTGVYPHMWVVKVTSDGELEWVTAYPYEFYSGWSIVPLSQGGYAIGGVIRHGADRDAGILVIDDQGEEVWHKRYGGGDWYDQIHEIKQLPDGGFVFAASTCSWSSDIKGREKPEERNSDAWIVRTDSEGEIIWETTWGDTSDGEFVYGMDLTADNGLVVAVRNHTKGAPVIDYHGANHNYDVTLLKYNLDGSLIWNYTLQGKGRDEVQCVRTDGDGGIVVCGWADSRDADFALKHQGDAPGSVWACKLTDHPEILVEVNVEADQRFMLDLSKIKELAERNDTQETGEVYHNEIEVLAYPNPTTTNLNIRLDGEISGIRYVVYNMTGQQVLEGKFEPKKEFQIPSNGLPAGTYVIHLFLNSTEKPRTIMFVKQ